MGKKKKTRHVKNRLCFFGGACGGGSIREFKRLLVVWVKSMYLRHVVAMVFVMDGMCDRWKHEETVRRASEKWEKVRHVMNTGIVERLDDTTVKPLLFESVMVQVLRDLQQEVIIAVTESDPVAARLCIDRRYDAVISKDSDFLIFPVPAYIDLESLNFEQPDHLRGWVITQEEVALALSSLSRNSKWRSLKGLKRQRQLTPALLPDLAVLMGNDIRSVAHVCFFFSFS